jgi:Protein of unknown function (DUF1579)
MKRGSIFVCVTAALVGAFLLGRAGAQEGDDMMAAFKELGTPGPEHAAMMKCAGTWICEAKEAQQDGSTKVTKGKEVRTAIFGGRFLKAEYEGEMAGAPFNGVAYSGFNKATKKYEMIWISSMDTAILLLTGTETEAGKAWEYNGSWSGPGGMQGKTRIVARKISDDQDTMEIYNNMGMGEMKCLEMTYTRAK